MKYPFQEIVKSIEASWHTMLMQLLGQLKTDLQLPKCLQVFGYLRRMQAFSNSDLKLKFLQARDAWLNGLLAGIPNNDRKESRIRIKRTFTNSTLSLSFFSSTTFDENDRSDPCQRIQHNHAVQGHLR